MACPQCGNKLEGSFNICPKCGFKLSALTEKSAQGRCHIITVKIILTLVQGVHLWYHRWIFNRWENLLDIKHKCIFSTINKDFMNIFPTQYSSLGCYKNVNDCLVLSIYICIVKKTNNNFCQIHGCLIYVTNQAIMVKQMVPHQHIQFQPLLRRKIKRKIKTMLLKKALLKYRWQGWEIHVIFVKLHM